MFISDEESGDNSLGLALGLSLGLGIPALIIFIIVIIYIVHKKCKHSGGHSVSSTRHR